MAFPDVAALLIAHLTPILAPDRVVSRIPRPRPARFHQVRRVGGLPQQPVRDRARIDVFSWAPTAPDAMARALVAREAIWALAGKMLAGVPVYRVGEFMAPRQDDDDLAAETTVATTGGGGTARVWATYELDVRADDVIHIAP